MSSHIEYTRFRRDESCTEEGCRARKFYISDGKKFCQRGHEQYGFTQTQQDEDDYNTQGKKTKRKKEDREKIETVLNGKEATELYLCCWQLVLWKQVHWLVGVKGFGGELETVVRDLWDLRSRVLVKGTERSERAYGSGIGGFSSTEEGGTGTDGTGRRSLGSRRSRRSGVGGENNLPKLIETLGLCYLGMLLMRLPVSLGEVVKWAANDEIIYTRAIKHVPKDMRTKLPPQYHSALEIKTELNGSALHRTILDMIHFYDEHYEMKFPPLNHHLLLYKHLKTLGLPIEIYPGVQRLAALLNITFSYEDGVKKFHGSTSYPEVRLISLMIIATKLCHPFDDIPRIPGGGSDPAAVTIKWSEWLEIMVDKPSKGLKRGEEIGITDADVGSLNGKKIDDYLDWYQRTWLDDRNPKVAEQILELFPLEDLPPRREEKSDEEGQVKRLKQVQKSSVWRNPQAVGEFGDSEKLKRPGEFYKRYRTIEELPENAKRFYGLAASTAGIPLRMLVKSVFHFEVQLSDWIIGERRKGLVYENSDTQSEDG